MINFLAEIFGAALALTVGPVLLATVMLVRVVCFCLGFGFFPEDRMQQNGV